MDAASKVLAISPCLDAFCKVARSCEKTNSNALLSPEAAAMALIVPLPYCSLTSRRYLFRVIAIFAQVLPSASIVILPTATAASSAGIGDISASRNVAALWKLFAASAGRDKCVVKTLSRCSAIWAGNVTDASLATCRMSPNQERSTTWVSFRVRSGDKLMSLWQGRHSD